MNRYAHPLAFLLVVSLLFAFVCPVDAQVSPVRLKVTSKKKSDYKTRYQSSDGAYRSREGIKSVSYTIEVMNVSGGQPRDLVIKWAILVEGQTFSYYQENGQWKRSSPLRLVEGESQCTLEFGKTHSFDTDVVELEGYESTFDGQHNRSGAKVLGYSVEVFINDQKVASDIQPASVKQKIEQTRGDAEKKRHRF